MQFELSSPMKKLNFQFDDNRDGNSIKFARENRYNMINIKQTIQIILNFQTFPSITIAKSLNKIKNFYNFLSRLQFFIPRKKEARFLVSVLVQPTTHKGIIY